MSEHGNNKTSGNNDGPHGGNNNRGGKHDPNDKGSGHGGRKLKNQASINAIGKAFQASRRKGEAGR